MINLKPELRVDGQVVATGGAITMGSAENVKMAFHDPTRGTDVVSNVIEAGEYWGVAVDVASISRAQVEGIRARLADTKAQLEAQQFDGLTKDDILGDLLYTTAMTYHAEMDMFDRIQANAMGLRTVRLPSQAIFKTSLAVEDTWGVPTSAGVSSLTMDVDRLLSLDKAFDGNGDAKVSFMMASGMNSSALEHSVPEQLFNTPDNPVEAVSAVKAIQIAAEQGIPVYTVTRENVEAIMPVLSLDAAVIDEIRNAVNAGNEVTVPQTNINFHGVAIAGYIAINPETGEGAYMISGGESGAKIIRGLKMIMNLLLGNGSIFDSYSEAFGLIAEGTSDVIGLAWGYLEECYADAFNEVFFGGIGFIGDAATAGLLLSERALLLPIMFAISAHLAFVLAATMLIYSVYALTEIGMECKYGTE
jgi:hypothetical protein